MNNNADRNPMISVPSALLDQLRGMARPTTGADGGKTSPPPPPRPQN